MKKIKYIVEEGKCKTKCKICDGKFVGGGASCYTCPNFISRDMNRKTVACKKYSWWTIIV